MNVREAKELKKCPFCGGEAILKINHGFHKEVVSAFAYCKECGVATRSYALKTTAVEAWNRRAMSTNALEKILEEIEGRFEELRKVDDACRIYAECDRKFEDVKYFQTLIFANDRAKDIVKEIIRSHMADATDADNDWIPCNERLPEDGTYLCTLDGELIGEQEPFTGMCGIKNGKWDEEGCVIAWKPLPEPYKQN